MEGKRRVGKGERAEGRPQGTTVGPTSRFQRPRSSCAHDKNILKYIFLG